MPLLETSGLLMKITQAPFSSKLVQNGLVKVIQMKREWVSHIISPLLLPTGTLVFPFSCQDDEVIILSPSLSLSFLKIFIYLSALDLSCGMRDL